MSSRFSRDPVHEVVPFKGLYNQGATCYLNSVLQVLFMTADFREALQRLGASPPESLDGCLKELFDDLRERDGLTYKITKALGITDGSVQADAAECFEKILRSLTNPEASQIFQGVLIVKNKCSKCNTERCDDNPCWSLPLELVDSEAEYRVADGITQYFRPSEVSGADQLFCGQCNAKADSSIKLELKHHPEVLTLLLKRFKFDYNNMCYFKVKRRVDIPHNLEIQSRTYELYAFVEHHGDLKWGHYTATIKSQEDEKWYNFNDQWVNRCYQFYQLDYNERSQNAYLLFYKKVPAEEALTEENNKACEPSETQRGETNEPQEYDEETVKSKKNSERAQSCDSAERQETEGKEEEKMNQKIIIVEKEEDLRDQMRKSLKKEEEDWRDQMRKSLKKEEEDLRDQMRKSLKKEEEDLRDQMRKSLKKEEEDLKDQMRKSLKKEEEDLRDQMRKSFEKQKCEENKPEHQAKASKSLTYYDLHKSSGGRSKPHEQQSEEKSTGNKINPGNQTVRGSIQSSINMGTVEVPRADLRAERVHNSDVSTLVNCFESSNSKGRDQSREETSNTSVEHDEVSRKNSCIQQRNDSRDAENKQRKNLQLPLTGGPALTNDGCDDGSNSVQRSRGLHRSSMSVRLQNQSSEKKFDFVTKRTQNEDIVYVVRKRKCNGETGNNQEDKHSDEGISEKNGQNESTVKRPASSPDDRKERTTIMSNVVKTGGSQSPCNREDHQTEHSRKSIQQDATYVQQRCPKVCLHPNFQQCSTTMTPGHTAPSACDPVSFLSNYVQSMTLTDVQTHDLTNMPENTDSRSQQILSNTHECGLNVASPNHDHFHDTYPNSQSHPEYSHHYSEHNMPVNTDSRSQQMLSNSQPWYDYNMVYSVPGSYRLIYQNVQVNNAYSYPSYSGHNMSAENVTSLIHGSLIATVCGSSVEQMHQISAPLGTAQLGSGTRSEIPRRETRAESSQENREQDSPNPRVITEDSDDSDEKRSVCDYLLHF